MNTVKRAKGIRKVIRKVVFGKPVAKYVVSGDRACGRMMREARRFRPRSGPCDSAILAWAKIDLAREIVSGFWDFRAA